MNTDALTLSEDQQTTWATFVGKLVLNCGAIENLVNLLLMQWMTDDAVLSNTLRQPFGKRLRSLVGLVSQQTTSENERKALLAALSSIPKLFEVRNTVAHNPVIVAPFEGALVIAIPRFKGKGRTYDGTIATVQLRVIATTIQGLLAARQVLEGLVTDRPPLTVTVERPHQ